MCDIRIAAETAKFAESFIKVGIMPGDGGAWFLPRVVGMSKAAEMSFTGEAIDASEAHQVLAFWKQHGPLARAPWLSACERTRKALGQGHALSTYLADLARQVAEVKP